MPSPTYRTPARKYAVLAAAALIAPMALASPAAAQGPTDDGSVTAYIVQLQDLPVATYDGGVEGMKATKAEAGEKVDTTSAESQEYADFLEGEQNAAVRAAGASTDDVIYRYDTAFNGVAVELSAAQADAIRKAPGVVNVWESEMFTVDTITTPDYLGLTGDDGVWQQEFGGPANAGEGMVVGIIDTGIWPENPSFAEMPGSTIPADWNGECVEGEDPEAENNVTCNNKVIGARYYDEEADVLDIEFKSPRDYDGHGSHTGATAAGNLDTPVTINGIDLGLASGMAPRAHIAAYKALWADGAGSASGSSVDLVAAIDDAVDDGVDVINYSVSGSSQFVVDPVELAFLGAAASGVFVSASAGNSGDTVGESSVAHNSPWTMTVAASTHDRNVNKELTLGDGSSYEGVGVGPGLESAPLVYAGDIAASGASQTEANECWLDIDPDEDGDQPSIDPEGAEGNIVICDRGTVARVDKSAAVAATGGVGMVLANTSAAQSLNGDFHSVPTVHVTSTVGDAVKAYESANDDASAAIGEPQTGPVTAPEMAGFSSYGPALAGAGDLLKPDITAPGVDVIAAVAPPAYDGEDFGSLSGTSLSAPHIAGLALLMMQENPEWGPAGVKSAMMTTARTTNTDGGQIQRTGDDASPLDYGSGEVVPAPAYNPGLLYDAGAEDWVAYACSLEQYQLVGGECDEPLSDPSDLNYPTIAIGDLAGTQTVTRTVTNVTDTEATYSSDTSQAPPGVEMTVEPATVTVPAGGEATFTVTFDYDGAALDTYTFGTLVWDGPSTVTSQIAIQPTAVATEGEISGTGASGSRDYDLIAGFDGTLNTDIDGLVAADVVVVPTVKTPGTTIDGVGEFDVPEVTKVLRFATYGEEIAASDIDLNIYNPDAQLVGSSGSGGSTEEFTIDNPVAGTWFVAVDLFSSEPSVQVPVSGFYVGEEDAGNLTVSPDTVPVSAAETVEMTATWSGLADDTRYMGAINYINGSSPAGRTLVSISVQGAPEVGRIAGLNRYDTAAKIALEYPGDPDTVFISSGSSFADALSGSSAAANSKMPSTLESGSLAAPILLTKPNVLPRETVAALEAIEPSQIVILGGTKSVT
ncbi:MAG: S8 family serine peptidase, partial [Ornithinimicrobium sp.]